MVDALLLNASYEPLAVIGWRKAVRLLFLEKAEVIESSSVLLRAVRTEMLSPSVIRLQSQVRYRRPRVKFSRVNVLRRDKYQCQYCGKFCGPNKVTVDHVVPLSRGGKSTWTNLVACCSKCNHRKDNRTPGEAGMVLARVPRKPQWMDTFNQSLREEWKTYVGGLA